MKKFSSEHLDSHKLWIPLLLIGIAGYLFIIYDKPSVTEFALLKSSLDGILYSHYFLSNRYPLLQYLFSSPMGMIGFLLVELLLWYVLFNDRKFYKNGNIRMLVFFLSMLLVSCIYVQHWSGFWMGQIVIFFALLLLQKNKNFSLLEMLFVSFLMGIAGLFYTGCYLFLFLLILYAFEQRHLFSYIWVSILGIIMPAYLLVSYIWLRYDEWMFLPHIFESWSWHLDIFNDLYGLFISIAIMLIGLIYLLVKQFNSIDVFQRISKFLLGYYFISLILFFTESNPQIAISIMVPAMSLLFNKKNKIK